MVGRKKASSRLERKVGRVRIRLLHVLPRGELGLAGRLLSCV